MKKKLVSILLTVAMTATILSGCGGAAGFLVVEGIDTHIGLLQLLGAI